MAETMWQKYRRTAIAEMADWHPGFDMSGVSVSEADREAGSPKEGDKIARNPANHADKWLVAADYFAANFAPLSVPGELVDPADLDYEAAMRPLDKFLHDDPWFPHERYEECPDIEGELVALIVRAALGVGETAEGNGE